MNRKREEEGLEQYEMSPERSEIDQLPKKSLSKFMTVKPITVSNQAK
jgi:hypothetical protein